jgi:hypothetical protein
MLNVIMLSVMILSVIMLNVAMLIVMVLSAVAPVKMFFNQAYLFATAVSYSHKKFTKSTTGYNITKLFFLISEAPGK